MKRYFGIPFCILLTVFLCQLAHSQDQPKSLDGIKAAALAGDPEAQFQLGYKYAIGDGVEKDPQLAVRWYMAAAEKGHIIAAHNLGACYSAGEGVPENAEESFKWFKKAADRGYSYSALAVGFLYLNGKGVKTDQQEAIKWLTKAAEMGSPEAQLALSGIYAKNPSKSFKWCKASAENGCLQAQLILGQMYEMGVGVGKNSTAAIMWLKKAADAGDATAERYLGYKYQMGLEGIAKNYQQAFRYYMLAAEQGDSIAQGAIALLYLGGIGVPKDYIEALAWFNISASAADNNNFSKNRDNLERSVGPQIALVAQKRSKEILSTFPPRKVATTARGENQAPVESLSYSGSGAIISTNGIILTAAHVVSNASHVEVITAQGRQTAKILQIDNSNDIAVIKCEGTFEAIPIASSKSIRLGQTIFSIGFPNIYIQGTSPKMTKGEISSLNGYQDDPRLWQISVPIQPGNSGGPLCDETGNLIGIVISKLNAVKMAKATGDVAENVGYAIKSAYISPLLDNLGITPPQSNRSPRNSNFVDQVDQVSKSVVMILAYSKK